MQIEHFKEIIAYSKKNRDEMNEKIRAFYSLASMENQSELLNLVQVLRPIFRAKRFFLFELPLKDKEIGAFCYKGDAIGYTFLNSTLPKVNVNFALCHELYHVLYEEKAFKRKVELYLNEYYQYEEEKAANLFAGMLLMPEQSFRLMFHKFSDESDAEVKHVLVKLMNYFETPYMATLLRSYELGLLECGEKLEQLICVDNAEIKSLFEKLWLDESILLATYKDDFSKLEMTVKEAGAIFIEKEYTSERELKVALKNMRDIYKELKGE